MQLDRIAYQYPDGTAAGYDFHPRLTVICAPPAHRRSLAEHLLQSLWTDAAGVHVEFTGADGAAFVAFRPYGSAPRVIGIDRRVEVTDRYLHEGRVNLLAPLAVEPDRALDLLLAGRDDLLLTDPTVLWTSRLIESGIEQVLAAAEDYVEAETALRRASTLPHLNPQSTLRATEAHHRRELATGLERRQNRVRVATLVLGTSGPIAAVALLTRIGPWAALAIVGASVATAAACIGLERRLTRAIDAEYQALQSAGAASYVDLTTSEGTGPDGTTAAEVTVAFERLGHETDRWQDLAGDIPAAWVIERRERLIEAAELSAPLHPRPAPSDPTGRCSGSDLLAALLERTQEITELGSGTSLPLFLDDPLSGLLSHEKVAVLNAISKLAAHQQLVICTGDAEVLDWATLETLAGRARVIDADPGRLLSVDEPSTQV